MRCQIQASAARGNQDEEEIAFGSLSLSGLHLPEASRPSAPSREN